MVRSQTGYHERNLNLEQMMSGALRLRLLGTVQAEWNGEIIQDFGSRKALALLGYLAANPGPVTRTRLVDLLWHDKGESSGRRNLSWVLSTISKRLPRSLQANRHTVAFDQHDAPWTDIEVLDYASRTDDIPALSAAVALYRGPFMDGIYVSGSPEFEVWLLAEREKWQKRIAETLGRLIDHHLAHDHLEIGRQLTEQLLALDPLREAAHRRLMHLLVLAGQRSAALLQFEACRRLLDKELGVTPSPETESLYHAILHGELQPRATERESQLTAVRPARTVIPHPLTPLVGREGALSEIRARLADPACSLLTIVGPGGIGKTRLALELAADQQGHFADGVFFVPLGTVAGPDVLITAVAKAIDFTFYIQETAEEQLRHYFRDKEMWLILDNFEHLLEHTNIIAGWLAEAPRLRILVTSQARLGLRGEYVFELEGLDYPSGAPGGDLERFSAVRLFLEGARQADQNFALNKTNAVDIAAICRLVEGSPLGLELASGWVSVLSTGELVAQLEESLNSLESSLSDLPQRQRSLAAAFEHSWSLLTPAQQAALTRISVFHGGFTREAAKAVADCSLETLTALVHRSFLRRVANGRYEMHESLRQNAGTRLEGDAAGETKALHGRFYARFLEQRAANLQGSRQLAALDEIETELDNVRAAWRWAIATTDLPAIAACLPALFRFYDMRSWFTEGADAFGQAAAVAQRTGDKLIWARLTARQGWFTFHAGRHIRAQALLRRSQATLEGLNARAEIPFCLNYLAAIIRFLGYNHDALLLVERSIALCRELDDRTNLAIALNIRGTIAFYMHDLEGSERYCKESLALKEAAGDRWGMAFSLTMLGRVAHAGGQLQTARTLLQQSLGYRAAVNDRRGMAINLNLLGRVAMARGETGIARHYLQDGLAITRAIGDRWNIITGLHDLAALALSEGDRDRARKLYRAALRTAGDIRATERTLNLIGELAPLIDCTEEELAAYWSHVFLHPASSPELKQSVAEKLSRLAATHPPSWLAEAQQAGETLPLAVVVDRLTDYSLQTYPQSSNGRSKTA